MKSKFFLVAGLLATAFGHAQLNSTFYNTSTIADGLRNTALGDQAGSSTSATRNVYIGNQAGTSNIIGDFNVMIGSSAGINNVAGNNVIIGERAASGNINGGQNVIIGRRAGENSTGSNNIFIGAGAGRGISAPLTGDRNIIIGINAGQQLTNINDELIIENSDNLIPLIHGRFGTIRDIRFNTTRVGIGYEDLGNSEFGFGDFPSTFDTSTLKYRFFVRGGILAEEVRIRLQSTWADYVFAEDYKLMPLTLVEKFINDNGHLPNMPSAKEVEEEGLAVGDIVKRQQEKIEELTLHLIEQQKEIEAMKAQLQQLINRK